MAHPLAALERFLERLLERPASRLFHAPLEPIQLQRRAERAMEAGRRTGADRTWVPNRYRVQLNPQDLAAFASYQATLEAELGDALLEHAHRRGYSLPEHPRVTLHGNAALPSGEVEVVAELIDPLEARPAPEGFRRIPDAPVTGTPLEATAVFDVPVVPAPEAVLVIDVPGRPPWRRPLEGGMVRIGRATDNDLVIPDERVSRHHGQIRVRRGALVYEDLGSTNGSYVNGARVHEIVLGPGDTIRFGDSAIVVEEGGAEAVARA